MGSLISRRPKKNIMMFGLENSGKTTLLSKIRPDKYTDLTPTLGFNIETLNLKLPYHKTRKVTIWDVGGRSRFIWSSYYQAADGIIFVIDSTDLERLDEAITELHKMMKDVDVPILVLINKHDPENLDQLDQIKRQIGDRSCMIRRMSCGGSLCQTYEEINWLLKKH